MSRGEQPMSSTDLLLFKHLANPEKSSPPDDVSSLLQLHLPKRQAESQRNDYSQGPTSQRQASSQRPASSGDNYEIKRNSDSDWGFFQSPDGGPKTQEPSRNSNSYESSSSGEGMFNSYVKREFDRLNPSSSSNTNYSEGVPSGSSSYQEDKSHYSSSNNDDQESQYSSSGRPNRPSYDEDNSEQSLAQRQHIIAALRKHQQRGSELSIDINRDTPLHILRTELDLLEEVQNSMTMVGNMRNGMNVFMRICEAGNKKIGEPVRLSGWTDKTFKDNPNLYDRSLERIYNLYWRNSYSHPMTELGTTILFSGGGYILQGYLSGESNSDFGRQADTQQDFRNFRQESHGPSPAPFRPPMTPPMNNNFGQQHPGQQHTGQQFGQHGPSGRHGLSGQHAGPSGHGGRPSFRPPFTSHSNTSSEPVTSVPTH